jgi:hypothetical protein
MARHNLSRRSRCRVEAWISALDDPGQPDTPSIDSLLHYSDVSFAAMKNIKVFQVSDEDLLATFVLRHFWDVKRTEVHEYEVPERPSIRNPSSGRIEIAGLMALEPGVGVRIWMPIDPHGGASSFLKINGIPVDSVTSDVEYDVHVRIEYVENEAGEPLWFWIHWYWEADGYFYSMKAGTSRPHK